MCTYAINQEFNGIEITFEQKPEESIRESLKQLGFRWHKAKKVWYAKRTEEREKAAADLAEGKGAEIIPAGAGKTEEMSNKFGVKVGDIFYASWGYDQTNVDFFQVIKLVGKTSVRVREVYPTMTKEEARCSMSADRTYEITKELLPAASRSVFIKDQENGDLKRLKSHAIDGISNPQFYLDSFANAYLLAEGEFTTYESWYA